MHNKHNIIDLWVGNYQQVAEQNHNLRYLLSSTEHERAERFRFKKDSQRYVFAHAALRLTLSIYSCTSVDRLILSYTPDGKPYLPNYPIIRFNLSHSKNFLAIAISFDHDVGVDIEECAPFADFENIAHKIMTRNEYGCFDALSAAERLYCFYRFWVRKEAVVKAWGCGIYNNLKQLDVSRNHIFGDSIHAEKKWTVKDINLSDGYAGAVCAEDGEFELKMKEIDKLF